MRDAAVGYQCPECVAGGQRQVRSARTVYGGRVTTRAGQLTLLLIVANVAVFLAELATGGSLGGFTSTSHLSRLIVDYEVIPGLHGEYYRLVTAMFLHFGIIHIGLNMYCLFLLGPPLERMLGPVRFLALYFGAGIAGSALSYATNQGGAGASGAIFGLFAAFFIFARQQKRDTSQIVAVIAINLVFSFVASNIGYWAHIGGLVAGGLIAVGFAYAPRGAVRLPVQVGGLAVVGLLSVALVVVGNRT